MNEEEKLQSPNWEHAITLGPRNGPHEGYPFNEGWPPHNLHPLDGPAPYEIVTAWGARCDAWIDYSQQYRADGIKWVILEPGRGFATVGSAVIAGWRRK